MSYNVGKGKRIQDKTENWVLCGLLEMAAFPSWDERLISLYEKKLTL